jgi:hypothetical protein
MKSKIRNNRAENVLSQRLEQNLANALIHVYVIRPELRAVKICLPNLVRLAAGQLMFAAPVRLW